MCGRLCWLHTQYILQPVLFTNETPIFFTSMMCLISKTSDVAILHNFYVCYLFEEPFVSNCSKPGTILGTVIEMKQKKKQKENNNKKISNLDELSCNGGKGGHSTQQQQICKIHNMLYKY